MGSFQFTLFVSGQSAKSLSAIANLRRICDEHLAGSHDIEVIDVAERPECAEEERILATPTLLKRQPPPVRRIVGDLSATDQVLLALGLRARGSPNQKEEAKP